MKLGLTDRILGRTIPIIFRLRIISIMLRFKKLLFIKSINENIQAVKEVFLVFKRIES